MRLRQCAAALCALLLLGGCAPKGNFFEQVGESRSLTGGTVAFTLPGEIPGELEIEAYAQVHDFESSSTSTVQAAEFEALNESAAWEPGKTYRAALLAGDVPDGTEVRLAVRLLGEEGGWKLFRWDYQDGKPRIQPDPRCTVASLSVSPDGTTTVAYSEDNGGRFAVELRLPEGWTLRETGAEYAALDILADGSPIGSMGYNEFVFYPGAGGDNYHRMVYGSLMLGNVVSWDNDYAPVRQEETGGAATCRVSVRDDSAPDGYRYHYGVLAHDVPLRRTVSLDLTGEAVTGAQARLIAESLRFVQNSTSNPS